MIKKLEAFFYLDYKNKKTIFIEQEICVVLMYREILFIWEELIFTKINGYRVELCSRTPYQNLSLKR